MGARIKVGETVVYNYRERTERCIVKDIEIDGYGDLWYYLETEDGEKIDSVRDEYVHTMWKS